MNFLSKKEKEISQKFKEQGYYIFDIEESKELLFLRNYITELSKKKLKLKQFDLNFLHKYLSNKEINDFRLDVFKKMNSQKWFGVRYYNIFKKYLDILVGNELAMQTQINLSIQMPRDKSSVLPMHADTFNGESPFEVVAWLPLVNCYSTKSMFILPNRINDKIISELPKYSKPNKGGMYVINKKVKKSLKFIDINFNQGLIFSPNLFHGNKKNITKETRWSLNTRFKSLMTPYTSEEKSLGPFYIPITIRQATIRGLNFKKPKKFN